MPTAEHGYVYELLRELGLSDFAARTGEFLLVRPLRIVLVVLLAFIASRIGARALRRAIRSVRASAPLPFNRIRSEQRAATLADVVASVFRAVVWSIAVLMVLQQLGINLSPLLAGAGIAGVAVGFGAQSLVKDVITGLFVLLEDQFGVGDVVTIGSVSGTVEDLTLRVSRIRADDGTVWFVPNGEIRQLGNSSMEWSRAVVDVVVPYDADLESTHAAIRDEAEAFAADPVWRAAVIEPPEVLGVEKLEAGAMTVRLVAKTAPREQARVARELRRRVSARLHAKVPEPAVEREAPTPRRRSARTAKAAAKREPVAKRAARR